MKISHFPLSLSSLLVFTILSCDKVSYFEERYPYIETPRALAHAACGDASYPNQTIEAINYGCSVLDGIEVDIQLSKDNTLWLSHDSEVIDENGIELGSFDNTTDEEIEDIVNSDSNYYYTRLDSALKFLSTNWPGKFVSLDIKRPEKLFTNNSYDLIADEIIRMVETYKLEGKVLIESSSNYLLDKLSSTDFQIETYFFCMGDFDKGVAEAHLNGYTGISFKINSYDELSAELVDLLHASGLKMQAFYVNEVSDIRELHSYGIDFMQTDNTDFYPVLASR